MSVALRVQHHFRNLLQEARGFLVGYPGIFQPFSVFFGEHFQRLTHFVFLVEEFAAYIVRDTAR